jgi:hypothetical protein
MRSAKDPKSKKRYLRSNDSTSGSDTAINTASSVRADNDSITTKLKYVPVGCPLGLGNLA